MSPELKGILQFGEYTSSIGSSQIYILTDLDVHLLLVEISGKIKTGTSVFASDSSSLKIYCHIAHHICAANLRSLLPKTRLKA
jgi:hypothetical protein